jgi:outer membrane receptor protein involved in Fe transport
LRDGFYRLGRYGLSNVDRLEVIRGPNAAIYGRSSPGGMINMISLQPKKASSENITISKGSYNQSKNQFKMTGSIDKASKNYYVLSLAQTDRHFPAQFGAVHNQEYYAAIAHEFSNSSRIQFSAEFFLQKQQAPQGAVPLIYAARTATPDNTATTQALGYDLGLASINPYGPNSELNRGSSTFTGIYEKQFNQIWSLRAGAYYFRARRWDYNSNTSWGAITIPVTGAVTTTRGALPSRGEIQEDGGGYQQDLKAHYWLANHTIEANTLFTIDYNDYYRWDPTWEYGPSTDPAIVAWTAAGSGRVVTLTSPDGNPLNLVPNAPINYFPNWYNTNELSLFSGAGNSITGGASLNGGTLTRRRT